MKLLDINENMFDYFQVLDPHDPEDAMETYNEMSRNDQAKLNNCLAEMFPEWFFYAETGMTREQAGLVEEYQK